jgi:hypothetical protein
MQRNKHVLYLRKGIRKFLECLLIHLEANIVRCLQQGSLFALLSNLIVANITADQQF